MSLNLASGTRNEIVKAVNGWDGRVNVSILLADSLDFECPDRLQPQKRGAHWMRSPFLSNLRLV
jgi:hypothetical protein